MKPWMRTALAVVLVLAIAAGGFFLPNLVAARLDRADQDTAFSLPAWRVENTLYFNAQ